MIPADRTRETRPIVGHRPLDDREFARCLARVRPALSRFAYSLTRNREDAHDFVQETCLRAWRARGRFAADTNFKAWCFRILRNAFLTDVRRRRLVRIESRGDEVPEVAVAPNQGWGLELRDLSNAWRRLTLDQQRAMELVAVRGLGYEHAARLDGVAIGTIKSRVTRARRILAEWSDRPIPLPAPVDSFTQVAVEAHVTGDVVTRVSAPGDADRIQIELLSAWRERRRAIAVT